MTEKLKMGTKNLAEENYRKLVELFPNIVTETTDENGNVVRAIDADILQQEINEKVVEGSKERYQFTWPDKKRFIALGNEMSTNTLRLDREKSTGRDGTAGSIDTGNIYIEGDNLEALKLLRETYLGKVQIIYIDPPYNTGNDSFVYNDDSSISEEEFEDRSGARDEEGNLLYNFKVNNESNGRFHTDWLNMMYPRLALAKDLLSDDGVIFISIDDNEQENLKKICDEIFGVGNFIANFVWEKAHHFGRQKLNCYSNVDYILCYGKQVHQNKLSELLVERVQHDMCDAPLFNASNKISTLEFPAGSVKFNIPDGEYTESLSDDYDLQNSVIVKDGKNANNFSLSFKSRWSNETCQDEIRKGTTFWIKTASFAVRAIYGEQKSSTVAPKQIIFTNPNNPMATKCRFKDEKVGTNENASSELDKLLGSEKLFSYPKPVSLVKYLVSLLYDEVKGDFDKDFTVLDFFSGSATTAQAVMELNAEDGGHRKFIMVQLPEACADPAFKNICEIGEERIRRAGKKIKEDSPLTTGDLDIGFRVYRVDDSNMKDVYYKPNEITQDMLESLAGNIKEGRTGEDLLIQIMLELGVDLSSKIEETEMSGKKVFSVSDGYMIACFDNDVTDDVVTQIAKTEPYYAVFRDSGMASDSVMTNYEQIFKTYSPKTIVKVL